VREYRSLLKLAQRRNRTAQNRLFEQCWPIAWRVAYTVTGTRELAEDAAQEAIVNVFRHLNRIDASRPLEPWVRRVATNAALSVLRRQTRQPAPVPTTDVPQDVVEWTEESADEELTSAVVALPEERRVVIVLHYWLDYSVAEIAEFLELPIGTVASRLARALQQLRLGMEEQHAHSA